MTHSALSSLLKEVSDSEVQRRHLLCYVFLLHCSCLTAEHCEWEIEDIGWQTRMPLSPGHLV